MSIFFLLLSQSYPRSTYSSLCFSSRVNLLLSLISTIVFFYYQFSCFINITLPLIVKSALFLGFLTQQYTWNLLALALVESSQLFLGWVYGDVGYYVFFWPTSTFLDHFGTFHLELFEVAVLVKLGKVSSQNAVHVLKFDYFLVSKAPGASTNA